MSSTAPALHRQIARVRRRLFIQTLVQTLSRCWIAALLAAVVWFVAEPFVVRDGIPNLRWYVLGGSLTAATLLAVALAYWRRTTVLSAALSLDERFQLKERVTTSLTLDPRDTQSSAAVALLADVDRRVAPLYVSDRFPIKVPWTAALVPAAAIAIVLLAFFYKPALNQAQAGKENDLTDPQKLVNAAEAQKKLDKIVKKVANPKVDKPQSAAMSNIDKELEKLARKPLDTKDDVRDAQKDITGIEDAMKKRDKDLADRNEAFKDEMKQDERLHKKPEKKDNPADKLENALKKGDFDKAKDEAERLSRKLQDQEQAKKEEEKAKEEVERLKKKQEDPKLTPEEREQAKKDEEAAEERLSKAKKDQLTPEQKENLEEQLKDEQDKLERLTRSNEEKKQELEEKKEKGEIDQEQLDRELEQLAKQEQDEKNQSKEEKEEREQEKKELQELAQKLGECQKCLKEGDDQKAGEKLGEASKLLKKLDNKGEQKDLQQKLKELQEVKKELAKAADNKGNGGKDAKNNNRASGPNQGGQGAGQRPLADDDGKTGKEEVQSRSNQDNKGEINVIDTVPGEGFKGPRKPSDLKEDIRRASQDAPEALDRQRLPRSASEMTRGYFDKLRGPDKAPEK